MNVIETKIKDVYIINPTIHKDDRGYFFESFSERDFIANVCNTKFVQDNESYSSYGTIRGMHFQKPPYAQAKLVRCVKGSVLDTIVDLRKESPTFGEYVSVVLDEVNHLQLFVPRGFAHGFSVLSKDAVFQYKCDNFYNKESEGGISPLDTDLNIDWGIKPNDMIINDRDRNRVCLKDLDFTF